MASESLTRFIYRLQSDPASVAAYRANPAEEMTKAALSASEKAIMLSGNESLIRAALGQTADRGYLEEVLTERAWKDEAFRKRLELDPRKALQEVGIKVPDQVKVHVHQDSPTSIHIVLPTNPDQYAPSARVAASVSADIITISCFTCTCLVIDVDIAAE